MENKIISKVKIQITAKKESSNCVVVNFITSDTSTKTKGHLKLAFLKVLSTTGKFLHHLFNQIFVELLSSIIAKMLK